MTQTYPQQLHKIWNEVLADDAVPAHSIIMEAMKRAFEAGEDKLSLQPST